MRAGSPALRWCAENQSEAGNHARCTELSAAAAKANHYLAVAAKHGHLRAPELRRALQHLSAQIGGASALIEQQSAAATRSPAAAQAAVVRFMRQLPSRLVRHTVPSVIPQRTTQTAVLAVGNPPAGADKVMPRLSARLTVLEGDAVQIVGQPKQAELELTDGPLRWVWTLKGAHAGRAEVRMELFVDPASDGGDTLTPVHYETWEDDITVEPSVLADMQDTAAGAGTWLFGGVTHSLRTALIIAAVAGAVLLGLRIRRRPGSA